jgi:CRP-like cAMP-binding protein
LIGGLVVVALPYDAPPRTSSVGSSAGRSPVKGLLTIARDSDLALVTTLGFVQTFTRGCLTVFTVVMALELLDTGEPGVGVLSAAVGAGGVVGSLVAVALAGRGGLATWFGVGVALFGAPLAVLGVVPQELAALGLLALVGVGNSLIDVAGFTILARRTDEAVLVRTFAGFEAVLILGVALGGLVAPLAVQALGPRGALVAVGLLAPAAVVLRRRALRRLDGKLRVRDADIAVLRAVPMLSVLPATTIEHLAANLERADYGPGEVVFEQGDAGDGYYVVLCGRAEVIRDRRLVNTLSQGAGFGDVALLGEVPRTATVRASTETSLSLAILRRAAFLTAVTGYPASAAAGQHAVAEVQARDSTQQRDALEDEVS